MRTATLMGSFVLTLALGWGGLQWAQAAGRAPAMPNMPGMAATAHANMPANITRGIAVIVPTKGSTIAGTIWFDKVSGGIHIHGEVTGLEAKSVHAIHIHEFGDESSADGMAAGGHYNPDAHQHGAPNAPAHHAGDLGNLTADDTGKATIDMTVDDISIADMKNPVIGRGIVIHAKADDFNTQPTGNAGGRLGVAVIGIAKNP